jgi:hypothetical protein
MDPRFALTSAVRRTSLVSIAALAAAAVFTTPPPASAQPGTDSIVVGGTLGADVSSADAYPAGPEVGGLVEFPFGNGLRVRGEVGLGFWDDDLPPFDGISDGDLRRHRIAGSITKSLEEATSRHRLGYYVGGGAGLYFYRFDRRDDSSGVGIHGLGGVEYLLPGGGNRWLVGGEAQLQIIGAPEGPADDDLLKVLHVAGFVKYRIPR